MSAARYTSMRKTVATANITKVHYPGKAAVNYNPLYSTIGCNPTYSLFMYSNPPCCKIPPGNSCVTYDGGYSNNNYSAILNGGNSGSSFTPLDGGISTSKC
jgi:hypothetical protein